MLYEHERLKKLNNYLIPEAEREEIINRGKIMHGVYVLRLHHLKLEATERESKLLKIMKYQELTVDTQ
jgi:hypothetical protein